MRAHHDENDEMLHTGFLKGFMDGSLGSRTAAMKEPYSDDKGNTGLAQYTQKQLNEMAQERAKADFQLGFHAIGDKANAMALEALSYAKQAGQDQNPFCRPAGQAPQPMDEKIACAPQHYRGRDRIEHAQVVDQDEIVDFRTEGVIASMQPSHMLTDMNWAEARLGPKRAEYSYAWKKFLDAGVRLAFGTDYPVEPIAPFRGLYAAVTRKNEAGTKEYYPENKITRGQALYAYTQGSAYAEFAEKRKGKLEPGYEADFILVDRDLYTVEAPKILTTVVRETWVGGQLVREGIAAKESTAKKSAATDTSRRRAFNGRVATKADAVSGEAIFYIEDGRSVPYRFGRDLPLRARLLGDDTGFPAGAEITILQAERGDTGDVLIGFVAGNEEGICLLNEIQLID
jgi:predicted amidohydrolase YtcJ